MAGEPDGISVGSENIEDLFKSATKYVESVAGKLEPDRLLYLYARYKQAKEGICTRPKPSMFDFQGKKKWEAWKKLGNMTSRQAMMEYVSFLSNIEPKWTDHKQGAATSGSRRNAGMGISVSTMAPTEEQLADQDKTVFDWCKEGNTNHVRHLVQSNNIDVNGLDEEGLALLHWASDRGYKDMVEFLLTANAHVNVKDCDGQTPLHYAVSCEHETVAALLLSHGADVNMPDNDGVKPLELADSSFKSLLQ